MSSFTNSPLVVFTRLSPHRSSPRNQRITKITPHHTASVISIENLGSWFAQPSSRSSSNYGIGSDGRVGMYVEERDRAWTSSSAANDNQAVTIEISNSATGGQWPVSDRTFEAFLDLCEDICRRNGMTELVYDGTRNGSLTHHQFFSNTTCPGPFLLERFPLIAREVTRRLNASVVTPPIIVPPPDFTEYRRIIQERCQFSHPQAVWDVIEQHPFAEALYRNLATAMTTPVTTDECKTIIQTRCNFSRPDDVWAVLSRHAWSDVLYRRLAAVIASDR